MKDNTEQAVNEANADTQQRAEQDAEQAINQEEKRPGLKFLQMLFSSLAAGFGVQSGKNRQRDFGHGDPKRFIILGITMTGVFLLTMMGIVKLVLSF